MSRFAGELRFIREDRNQRLGSFVAGADTGVGTNAVSSVVVTALPRLCEVSHRKPVQTDIEADDDTAEIRRLAACETREIGGHVFLLRRPLSPHRAARLAKRLFAIPQVIEIWERLPAPHF